MSEPLSFDALCEDAVSAFLQSVVVVDNEASLKKDEETFEPKKAARRGAGPAGPGVDESAREKDCFGVERSVHVDKKAKPELDDKHRLDLNTVSRAFAEHKLTCGVYLPSENDPEESTDLVAEAVKAILPADACILDWQLRQGSSRESIQVVQEVLKVDRSNGGRLRLIVIYTAEELLKVVEALRAAVGSDCPLDEAGEDADVPSISGEHFRIVFLNKPTVGSDKLDPARVEWSRLPERTISEFKTLSSGLLRSFALHSVAAIRRDMHRILAKFDSEFDPVFASDRASKSDPDDAGRLVSDIFLSEIANTLSSAEGARRSLEQDGVLAWLEAKEEDSCFRDEKGSQITVGSRDFPGLDASVRKYAAAERGVSLLKPKAARRIHNAFFKTDQAAKELAEDFASLATMSRHRWEGRDLGESPRLSLGSIIRDSREGDETNRVFLCVQPLCDSVRMETERPFLLAELVEDNENFEVVLPSSGRPQLLRLPKADERNIESVKFPVSKGTDTVVASCEADGDHFFVDSLDNKWFWLADLREMQALQLGKGLLNPLGRVGLNSFEWLRLKGPKE